MFPDRIKCSEIRSEPISMLGTLQYTSLVQFGQNTARLNLALKTIKWECLAQNKRLLFFAVCAHLVKRLCNCSSSKVLCAPFTGSQVHFCSESKRTDDCEKHFARIYWNIGAYCVLEYSKYYDSHSYWMFNNNNKQIEETKRFEKCLLNCISFVFYISSSRPWLNCQNLIVN